MLRSSLVFSSVLISVLMACGAYLLVLSAAPEELFDLPGETWANGWLGGEEIHLLPSGQCAFRTWTDVGDGEEHRCSWARSGDKISLQPIEPGATRRMFRAVTIGNCTVLRAIASGRQDRPDVFEAYSRWPSRCSLKL